MMMPQTGERYLLKVRPTLESKCGGCGRIYGNGEKGTALKSISPEDNGMIVTVKRKTLWMRCSCCGFVDEKTGWFLVEDPTGMTAPVPYTWLEPLDWRPR